MKRLAALSFLFLVGCASNQVAQPLPFFPQLAPPLPGGLKEVRLLAAFGGKLVVENDCVKLRYREGQKSTTVLWYQGIELRRDKLGLFLRSSHTGKVTRFNVPVAIGGGQASPEYIQRAYPEVARRCGPPYALGYPADD